MPEENNYSNSPETTPSDQFSDSTDSELSEPDQENQSPRYSVFFIALAALLMMLGLGYYLGTRSSQPVTQPTTEAAPTSPAANGQTTPLADLTGQAPEAAVAQPKSIAFIKNFQLFIKESSENNLISKEGEKVRDFVQSPDGKYIAYIHGTAQTTNDFGHVTPNTVVLHEIASNTSKTAYFLEVKGYPNAEFTHQVRFSPIFSDDSKKIAISSSDGLYVYDITTSTLTQLIQNPDIAKNINGERGGIYGYRTIDFSPSGQKILASASYYEGGNPFVIGTSDKKIQFQEELKNFSGYGATVKSFLDENTLLATRTTSIEGSSVEKNELVSMKISPSFSITTIMEHSSPLETLRIINPSNISIFMAFQETRDENNKVIGSKPALGKISNITTTPKIEQIYILEEFKNFPSDGQIGYIYDVWDENTLTAALHQAGVTHLVKVDLASKTIEILEQNIDQPNY